MTSIMSTALNGLSAASEKAARAASHIAGVDETNQSVNISTPSPQDIIDIKVAAQAYKANIAVVKVDNDMSKELLGLFDETV